MLPVHVFDFVLDAIDATLGAIDPEQGGAVLGLPGRDVLTSFVHDPVAEVTRVEYRNSQWLLDEVRRREGLGAERFKGIAHSHPALLPRPSQQDRYEFGTALLANPVLGRYLAPVVTHDLRRPVSEHQLATPRGARISFFGAVLADRRAHIEPMRPKPVPLRRSLERAGLPLPHVLVEVLDDVPGVSVPLARGPLGPGWHLFVTEHFPFAAPVLHRRDGTGEAEGFALTWDLGTAPPDRLARALDALDGLPAQPEPPARAARHRAVTLPAGAPAVGPPTRPHPEPAPRPAPAPPPAAFPPPGPGLRAWLGLASRRTVARALFERTGGLLSPRLRDSHVLLVGAGSVGSYLADVLVRSGVGRLTVVDPERVEPPNLGRALYGTSDLGAPKARATAGRLRTINPRVRVTARRAEVAGLSDRFWRRTLPDVDLVIAATDDNSAQRRLNHLAYWFEKPAVFPGLYVGAGGGEVVFSAPGLPCWDCSTGGVRDSLGDLGLRPATDYGTGRPMAVPGLLPDIQHAASAAAKIALALLHPLDGAERITHFLRTPVAEGLPLVLLAMEPDHWFFPQVLGAVPGQYAYQSVWPRTARRPDCRVCGDPADRTDPFAYRDDAMDPATTRRMQEARAARRREEEARAGRTAGPGGTTHVPEPDLPR